MMLRERRIEAAIFDIDGTVYPQEIVDRAYLPVQTYLAELILGSTGQASFPHAAVEPVRQAYVGRSIAAASFQDTFVSMGGRETDYSVVESQVHTFEYLQHDEALLQMFSFLSQHLRLGILSQSRAAKADMILSTLIGNDWLKYFNIVVCCDTPNTPNKPDPEAFIYVASQLGASSENTAMVGDLHSADIAPAVQVGMLAIQVNRQDSLAAALHLARPHDLINIATPCP